MQDVYENLKQQLYEQEEITNVPGANVFDAAAEQDA
jgi:hypothetical protein